MTKSEIIKVMRSSVYMLTKKLDAIAQKELTEKIPEPDLDNLPYHQALKKADEYCGSVRDEVRKMRKQK